jgi:aspartate-semialdehyde dehydrogenase
VKLAVIGATGLVGRTMLQALEERNLPVERLIPVASERSRGTQLPFRGEYLLVSALEDGVWKEAQYALLSPGARISRQWIPKIAAEGVICIDNSSAFRLESDVPLIVPEVNPDAVRDDCRIIANPNCSTIQMVVTLAPLHAEWGLEEVVVCTYQSASGAGQTGAAQLLSEIEGEETEATPFQHRLFLNVIPMIGKVREHQYCTEEWKMIHETRKILGLPDLIVHPTTVRVPTLYCHAEAVHLRFREKVTPDAAREVLERAPGVTLQDDPQEQIYPLPLECAGKDGVFVGRIRQNPECDHTLDLWIVADNLRKGAAVNAVQILELLLRRRNR